MGQDNHTTGRGKWKQLSEKERYKIEGLLRAGHKPIEIARMLGSHRRTIERKIRRGGVLLRRENPYASRNPAVKDFLDEEVYAADVGQRRARENASNKGRGLKIGHDHMLTRYLEKRAGRDGFSPDAAVGEIKAKGLIFKVTLCTKTVYNTIERGDFLNLTNKDLPVKRNNKKRKYRHVRKVALNNLKGRGIEERPEAIKILEKKDHRGIAEFILPSIKEAEEVTLEHTKLSVPDMREVDYLAQVKLNQENFILHIEFESSYRSNIEMQKRMLRYYTYIKWHNDLPIYQVLVLLKKPDNVKRIKNGINSRVQGLDVMRYRYGVIKAYEIDKYEVLAQKQVVFCPLRVFMKHDSESEEEHIQECLMVTEGLEDKDYYFLTLECIKKLYQKGKYEKFVKEEILMQSALYKEPYEKGLGEGIEKGRKEEKVGTIIRFLTKRFGPLPLELKNRLPEPDLTTLDVILDRVYEYKDLDEVKKYIQ